MKTVICTVKSPCYHPATTLRLVPGEMEVTEAVAKQLVAAGLAKAVTRTQGKATQPSPREEKDHG